MSQLNEQLIRFESLVPAYVNETLDGEDLIFFKDYLAKHPVAEREIQFDRLVQKAMIHEAKQFDTKAGAAKLIEQLNAQKHTPWWSKITWLWSPQLVMPAGAFALGVLTTFGLDSVLDNPNNNAPEWEKVRSVEVKAEAHNRFNLMLKPNATHAQITTLLQQANCKIEDGPTDNGTITINCAINTINTLRLLEEATIVDDVIQANQSQE